VKTREPGDLPEQRHPSAARGARVGRTSAVVTNKIVTRWGTAMRSLLAILSKCDVRTRVARFAGAWVVFLCCNESAVHAADLSSVLPTKAPPQSSTSTAYDWTGFYLGGHLGYAWGNSNFTGPGGISGSLNPAQQVNQFDEAGSWFLGVQGGYNYMLPNRFVLGAEVDASFPSFQNLSNYSIGGIVPLVATPFGPETYEETVLSSGTVRGRVGYAPGNWLFYVTGGFAWSYNQLTLTNNVTGATDMPFLWRLGWAAGAGVEVPVAPHWTARLEYLYTDYGNSSVLFANNGQRFSSDWSLNEVRAGLNYQFGTDPAATIAKAPDVQGTDILNFHGQTTVTWQGYPPIRSPYEGLQSLPGSGQGRETVDAILGIGVRLWRGAEVWIDPEIDQGFGLADTHGVAGFPSGESYKLGFSYPYARFNRYFVRQVIDLGGDTEKVNADFNQFEESQTANRVVLTVGKFYQIDIFDTNKYANNSKADFLNWSIINNGAYDFGSDAWSDTYGVAAEWYQGNWTLRAGFFDMAYTPAVVGGNSALGYGLDPSFHNFQLLGEIEYRYSLWGQPGKIKVTGDLIHGDMGSYNEAVAFANATGIDASDAMSDVRKYQYRPGILFNMEQQVTENVGLFGRAGWADGQVESWNNTDIDRTVEAGLSFGGKLWNRPDDSFGIAGVMNGISAAHIAFFNAGGYGIVIGDGQLPHPGLEQIIETYYRYSLSANTTVSVDYQFVNNPAYNTDRGPVNVFAARFHWQF
jgi:high affinity Mn2+ porin